MPCICNESYTVTDTWEDTYYIVPKASLDDIKGSDCKCGDEAPSGNPINGKQYYTPCAGPSTGTFVGGKNPTQSPEAGTKVAIGEPRKTGSKKEPDKQKCSGSCSSNPGPIMTLKDEKTVIDNKAITVDYEIKDVRQRCECPDELGNTMSWEIPCGDMKVKLDVKAEVFKRERVQQYTVSISCKS